MIDPTATLYIYMYVYAISSDKQRIRLQDQSMMRWEVDIRGVGMEGRWGDKR